jgi:hypothetical protein
MKTPIGQRAIAGRHYSNGNSTAQPTGISLQQLINQLLGNSMATAFRNKSLVINEVTNDVMLAKEKITVAPVIRDLLATVIANSSNGQIYISAERFRDIITIQVQERSNNNGYALASSLRVIEAEATLIGGSISINGAQQRVVTISLSFSNTENLQYDC